MTTAMCLDYGMVFKESHPSSWIIRTQSPNVRDDDDVQLCKSTTYNTSDLSPQVASSSRCCPAHHSALVESFGEKRLILICSIRGGGDVIRMFCLHCDYYNGNPDLSSSFLRNSVRHSFIDQPASRWIMYQQPTTHYFPPTSELLIRKKSEICISGSSSTQCIEYTGDSTLVHLSIHLSAVVLQSLHESHLLLACCSDCEWISGVTSHKSTKCRRLLNLQVDIILLVGVLKCCPAPTQNTCVYRIITWIASRWLIVISVRRCLSITATKIQSRPPWFKF